MNTVFNEKAESRLLNFVQKNFGMEVFTPGLERTGPIFGPYVKLAKEQQVKVTIIAGTNGKGQTAHTLVHFLETAKFNCALWTSPHILTIRERFRVRGEEISYEDLESEIYEAQSFLQKMHPDLQISFYEFLFLVFLRLAFKNESKNSIDHLILEVGLGGKLDAVNHFDADCACITSISRDHQSILGSRYEQILSEKIAISRSGRPLFTQFKLQYLNYLTENYCQERGVLWYPLQVSNFSSSSYFDENRNLAIELFRFHEPLKQLTEIDLIPVFKGRREEMTFNGNTLIFIGAHNIDGVRRMTELFSPGASKVFPSQLLISFSKRPSQEVEIMLKTMVDFFGDRAKLSLTSFVHPKALELSAINELEVKFNKRNKGLLDFVTDWKTDLKKSKGQTILVCGSYYFVGEVQRFIHSPS